MKKDCNTDIKNVRKSTSISLHTGIHVLKHQKHLKIKITSFQRQPSWSRRSESAFITTWYLRREKTKITLCTEVTWRPVFSAFYEYFTHSTIIYRVLIPSPHFIPRSVFYTQSVVLSSYFIPQSVFYTQSLVRSPQSVFDTDLKRNKTWSLM